MSSFNEIAGAVEKCRDKLCYARIHIEKPSEGILSIYILKGRVFGAVLRIGSDVFYGVQALKNKSVTKLSRARVIVYEFSPDVLAPASESLAQYLGFAEERAKTVEIGVAEKPREEARAAIQSIEDLRKKILGELANLGFSITELTIAEGAKVFAIDVIYDKSKPLHNPEELSLPLLRLLLIYYAVDKDVRISIHHRKTFSKTYEISKRDLWILLGLVPELILTKYGGGLRIDDIKYKEKRGEIEISITLRREALYSIANVQDIARELYEELKKHWHGKLSIRVRIGRLGLEGRAP